MFASSHMYILSFQEKMNNNYARVCVYMCVCVLPY